MPQITARDTATGKTVTFNWNGAGQPSDADMAEVFKAAASQGQAPEMDSRGSLPSMHRDAPRTSIEDPSDTLQSVNRSLEGAAHPRTLKDIASLIAAPVDATRGVALSMLQPMGQAAAKYGGAAKDMAMSFLPQKAKTALSTLSGLNPMEWNSPLTVAGRAGRQSAKELAFNDAPLYQQMDRIPTQATGPLSAAGRPQTPPLTTLNPNDAPLYQQMEQLADAPSNGAMYSRSGMPRMATPAPLTALEKQVAQAAKANRLSPEAQARLLEALKLRVSQ